MNADQNITSGQGAASGGPGLMLWVFLGLFVVGIGSLLVGGADGAAQSDTKLLIVSFLFLMGVSQAGIVFCAITRLTLSLIHI